jgi:predicted DNA-binding transcriptional regulator AlpA
MTKCTQLTAGLGEVDGPFGADDGHLPALANPSPDAVVALLTQIRDALSLQSAELLSREQLAALLSISPRTVDRLAATPGSLPVPVKLPGCTRVLWRRREVLKWIENGCAVDRRRAVV